MSTRIIRMVFIVFFLFPFWGVVFFSYLLIQFGLRCMFFILHVPGLCNYVPTLILGGVRSLFAGFVQYVLYGFLMLRPS